MLSTCSRWQHQFLDQACACGLTMCILHPTLHQVPWAQMEESTVHCRALVTHPAVHDVHALVRVVKVHHPCCSRGVVFACLLAIIGCTLLHCRSAQGNQSHQRLRTAAVQLNSQ